jgi:hypothetical protein
MPRSYAKGLYAKTQCATPGAKYVKRKTFQTVDHEPCSGQVPRDTLGSVPGQLGSRCVLTKKFTTLLTRDCCIGESRGWVMDNIHTAKLLPTSLLIIQLYLLSVHLLTSSGSLAQRLRKWYGAWRG